MPREKCHVIYPPEKNALQRSPGRGRAQLAGALVRTPYLGQGRSERAAGWVPVGPERTRPSSGAAGCPSPAVDRAPHCRPSATLLPTPSASALLVDVNGSVRSKRNLFLSSVNSKLKKKNNPEAAVGSLAPRMPVRTPPPAASTLRASPQLAAVGAKNQSEARAIGRAGRQRHHLGQGRSLALL